MSPAIIAPSNRAAVLDAVLKKGAAKRTTITDVTSANGGGRLSVGDGEAEVFDNEFQGAGGEAFFAAFKLGSPVEFL